ncbi:MAG TPA: hypothetical protein VFH68_14185 [Polyangia bacterium]|jgi:hypothetical protein|nr:hypothetical protein [Polyangia bacterium]
MSADTSRDIAAGYAQRLMALPPARRVAMCLDMSTSARAMVRRSLEQRGLAGDQLADALVARLYGSDLSPKALAECQRRVRRRLGGPAT